VAERPGGFERRRQVAGLEHLDARVELAEQQLEAIAKQGVVVNDQDSHGRGGSWIPTNRRAV
jgi:hypothetical protein